MSDPSADIRARLERILSRRDLIVQGLACGTALSLASSLLAAAEIPTAGAEFDVRHDRLLRVLGDLTIPQTSTAGAGTPENARFVSLALRHELFGALPDDLTRLEAHLDARAKGSFLSLKPVSQEDLLGVIDREVFEKDAAADATGWRSVKRLLIFGYYTSEIGATRELRYELVPGRFDADLVIPDGGVALSNDTTANSFT